MLNCQFSRYQAMLTARRHFTCYLRLWFIVIAYCLLLGLSGCSKPTQIISPSLSPTVNRHVSTPHPSLPSVPTSTSTPTPTPTPPPSPTPTPTSTLSSNNPSLYDDFVRYYFQLVTSYQFHLAYRQLSAQLQTTEPYSDFVNNQNYTLSSGCWNIVRIPVTKKDGSTWNVGVELTYTSCADATIIFYYWNFHIQIKHGHPVITRIGLYPTEVQ